MARKCLTATVDGFYKDAQNFSGVSDIVGSFWLWRDDNTQNNIAFELVESATGTNGFDYVPNAFLPGDLIRSYYTSGAAWSDKWNPPAATGAWHHYFWVIPGTGEGVPPPIRNQIWLDGVQQTLTVNGATNGAGVYTTNGPFSIMFRRNANGGAGQGRGLSGRIADFAMWSSDYMTRNPGLFASQLARGANPMRVRRVECILYLPFFGVDSPEPDLHGAQNNYVVSGAPTRVNNPPTVRSFVNWQD